MYNEGGTILLTYSLIHLFIQFCIGRFAQSARYYKEIAEIYEKDGNTELAMNSYQEAANIFENDNKRSAASQCIAKVLTDSLNHTRTHSLKHSTYSGRFHGNC